MSKWKGSKLDKLTRTEGFAVTCLVVGVVSCFALNPAFGLIVLSFVGMMWSVRD